MTPIRRDVGARAGFTLIEILVSVAILGTSLVAALSVLSNASKGAMEADARADLESAAGTLAGKMFLGEEVPKAGNVVTVDGMPGTKATFETREERLVVGQVVGTAEKAAPVIERVTIRLFQEEDPERAIEVQVLRRPVKKPGETRP